MRWHLKLIHRTYVAWDGTWRSISNIESKRFPGSQNEQRKLKLMWQKITRHTILQGLQNKLNSGYKQKKTMFSQTNIFLPKKYLLPLHFLNEFWWKLNAKNIQKIYVLKLYSSISSVEKDKNLAFKKTRVLLFHILDSQLPEILPLHISRLVSETKLGRRCATGKTWTTAKQISRQLQCWS